MISNPLDYRDHGSFVNRVRRKRFALLKETVTRLRRAGRTLRILDIGGDVHFWRSMGWDEPEARVTLLNLGMTSLAPEEESSFEVVVGNALELPYVAGDFDLVFSNSVIEHVGSWANQQRFASEVQRMQCAFLVQTPSLWFPLEAHSHIPLFQFIPHRLRALAIMRFNINYFPRRSTYAGALQVSHSTRMLTKRQFARLFPGAAIHTERLFGLTKSYTVESLGPSVGTISV